jgi:hypothetical protein
LDGLGFSKSYSLDTVAVASRGVLIGTGKSVGDGRSVEVCGVGVSDKSELPEGPDVLDSLAEVWVMVTVRLIVLVAVGKTIARGGFVEVDFKVGSSPGVGARGDSVGIGEALSEVVGTIAVCGELNG